MDTIGAGTGMYVGLEPMINKITLGPDSAGHRIGMCVQESTPTLNDCNLVLGYLNPDYFLGGDVKLDKARARAGIQEQLADPLGISVEAVAWGVVDLVNTQMRDHLYAMILGRGFSAELYSLLCYGGGGPLHLCGYVEGLDFERILIPSWAPAFSAFGCACADYTFRYDQQVDMPLAPGQEEMLVGMLNGTWDNLKMKMDQEEQKVGLAPGEMGFQPFVRMQYLGQLDDLEIPSPAYPVTLEHVPEIIHRFERKGLKIVGMKMAQLGDVTLEEHYAHHKEKPFFAGLKKFMKSSPVVMIVLSGINAIAATRLIVGPTRGYEADAGSIRGDFALSGQSNIVHASDSSEAAAEEIKRFFSSEELFDYKRNDFAATAYIRMDYADNKVLVGKTDKEADAEEREDA